jgi:hypothetical protein
MLCNVPSKYTKEENRLHIHTSSLQHKQANYILKDFGFFLEDSFL